MESDCNSESSVDGYDSELEEASVNSDMKCELSELPLCQRLAVQNSEESISAVAQDKVQKRRRLERFRESKKLDKKEISRTSKNAPAEMRSDRPVRRLRTNANNSVKTFTDPRFTEISGKLDEKIFSKNYAFLDDYRDKEIDVLSKTMRKLKSEPKKEELKAELMKMKQQVKERRRGLRVAERLDSIRTEEREKVKLGKKPFFLKASVRNTIGLEERYKELRKEGKLHKFMEKRRKKNSNKDHRWMPSRRPDSNE